MTITITIYELSALLVAIGFLAFIIALIPAILQIRRTAAAVQTLSVESAKTAENLNVILKVAGEEACEVKEVIARLKGTGLKAADLADGVLEDVGGPVARILSLIFTGAESFLKCFLAKKCGETEGGAGDDKHQ